jgi:hypothetical protein
VAYLVNDRHDSTTGTAEHPAPADRPKLVDRQKIDYLQDSDLQEGNRSL